MTLIFQHENLKMALIDTPLGPMRAIGDTQALYLLEFSDQNALVEIEQGETPPLISIRKELQNYFNKTSFTFSTPLSIQGTPFQKKVWEGLCKIPKGEKVSYGHVATQTGQKSAVRAVGTAIGKNRFAIVIPCHRVVRGDGSLGGYAGGIERKQWLLRHETGTK